MSRINITDVSRAGVDPTNLEVSIYPKGERPPYPKRNECRKCWEEKRRLVKGKIERYEMGRSIKRIYECPRCHTRWQGQTTRKKPPKTD